MWEPPCWEAQLTRRSVRGEHTLCDDASARGSVVGHRQPGMSADRLRSKPIQRSAWTQRGSDPSATEACRAALLCGPLAS